MIKVGIRVDGNNKIATGHIMRCLSIARALSSNTFSASNSDVSVSFIVSDEASKALLEECLNLGESFNTHVLSSEYNNLETEVDKLVDYISQNVISLLLVDSYFVTEKYFTALHKHLSQINVKLAYLDDLQALNNYDIDVIINYDTTVKPAIYNNIPYALIGSTYTPLREQFINCNYVLKDNVSDIFISAGGTDTYNISQKLIEYFMSDEFICKNGYETFPNLHILTSKLNSHYDELINVANKNLNVYVYSGLSDVASLMSKCDLAICAGGTTLCELCALGVPTISFALADNQLKAVTKFDSLDIIPYAGDIRANMNTVLENICNISNQIIKMDISKRTSIFEKMRHYIDGNGSNNIAKSILDIVRS